jgi:hypothetical protein
VTEGLVVAGLVSALEADRPGLALDRAGALAVGAGLLGAEGGGLLLQEGGEGALDQPAADLQGQLLQGAEADVQARPLGAEGPPGHDFSPPGRQLAEFADVFLGRCGAGHGLAAVALASSLPDGFPFPFYQGALSQAKPVLTSPAGRKRVLPLTARDDGTMEKALSRIGASGPGAAHGKSSTRKGPAQAGHGVMKRTAWLNLLLLPALAGGCVTRRYLITSDPPGAMVFRNNQPVGHTPLQMPFLYYGKYKFQLVKDGYETLDVEPELAPPWYEWPGLDFVSENVIPYKFRDVRCFHYQLVPLASVRPDDVRRRADQLRDRGQQINPKPPAPAPAPPPAGVPPGNVLPPGIVVPPGGEVPPGGTFPPAAPPPTPVPPAPAGPVGLRAPWAPGRSAA